MNPMFYIHRAACISAQHTFSNVNIEQLNASVNNRLTVIEPSYESIPTGILRRMGKAVRIGVGAALPLMKEMPDGIIIGTANGGMEDCIKFLNQIIDYKEGMLTPGNFVQSTTNALAGQLGMMSKNTGYNITHAHRALSFENAMIDAFMLLQENTSYSYLLGGVDEISAYNYNIEYLAGWYKKKVISNHSLYETDSAGTLAGEGAAMFLVNNNPAHAMARLQAVLTLHEEDEAIVAAQLSHFLATHLPGGRQPDLLLTGENGDNRLLKYETACEELMTGNVAVARFKHLSGEFPTASAIAVWLACYILKAQHLPQHMFKRSSPKSVYRKILIYNNYQGLQHSFILLSHIADQ